MGPMGIDDYLIEVQERGWESSAKAICLDCVDEPILARAVEADLAPERVCSFCGGSPAAEFDTFMSAYMVGVNNEFEPVESAGVAWDSAEGGYQADVYDSWDLPDSLDWVAGGDNSVAVIDEIRACLGDGQWVRRYWIALEPDRAFGLAWREFCQEIMYRTRFVFWARTDNRIPVGAGEIRPAEVLERIGRLIAEFGLISTLDAGTTSTRVRGHDDADTSSDWKAADLGTNLPKRSTTSSRMSPAGIPLFYGADDLDTALAEVAKSDRREYFTAVQFRTTQAMSVLDLACLPDVPSIFDPHRGHWWGEIKFLHDLVHELRQPVEHNRINLDYVPTQVFTEYFLRVANLGTPIHGLIYLSAVTEGRCVALEVAHADCVDTTDPDTERPQLELVPGTMTVHQRRTDEFRQL